MKGNSVVFISLKQILTYGLLDHLLKLFANSPFYFELKYCKEMSVMN